MKTQKIGAVKLRANSSVTDRAFKLLVYPLLYLSKVSQKVTSWRSDILSATTYSRFKDSPKGFWVFHPLETNGFDIAADHGQSNKLVWSLACVLCGTQTVPIEIAQEQLRQSLSTAVVTTRMIS